MERRLREAGKRCRRGGWSVKRAEGGAGEEFGA